MKYMVILVFALLTIGVVAIAEVPQCINFQGRLLDSGGEPVDGAKLINFIIWKDATSTDFGDKVWESGFQNITISAGLFSIQLGAPPMPALPHDACLNDTSLYLGITVDTDNEMTPRTKLVSTGFAYQGLRADTAASVNDNAVTGAGILDGTIGIADINTAEVQARVSGACPAGEYVKSVDPDGAVVCGVDQGTDYTAGSGLQLVGTEFSVESNAVTTDHIADNTIMDADINNAADIAPEKINGTAVILSSAQTITGDKTFNGDVKIGSNTFTANSSGIVIGADESPSSTYLVRCSRAYSFNTHVGLQMDVTNSGNGLLYGIVSYTGATDGGTGWDRYGVYSSTQINDASSNNAYAFYGTAGNVNRTSGKSYGLFVGAGGGTGCTRYGVYSLGGSAGSGYAGYFSGDVSVVGTLSKSAGSFKIDHPLDPENKYLQHSFVESPDMMNIYNGNVTTDAGGYARVMLPDYFDALNKDFRYQLTVIGTFAQAIVAEKINGNSFVIQTDKPNVEVSWQVTGIRHDRYAEAHPIQVEVDKPAKERGRYLNYEAYGVGIERAVDREQLEKALAADRQSTGPDLGNNR